VLRRVNDHFKYMWEEPGFVTAAYGVYDDRSRVLQWACAGHCPPMLYRAGSGKVEEFGCNPVMPLMIDRLENVPVTEMRLAPRDRLLFYTDGVLDRTDASDNFFGDDRLRAALENAAAGSPGAGEIIASLTATIEAFADGGEPPDDQTLLVAAVR
jgi:sigma-B regulation protein RsbU (phosphoserine phosphatase)